MKNGMLYVLITAICFTTFEPVSKLIAGQMDPFAITAIRFLLGSLILLPFSILEIKKRGVKLNLKDFAIMSGLGILVICISMGSLQIAVRDADSPALIAVVFSSNSIITIALSAIFLKTKLTPVKIIGIVLCAIGVLVSADITTGSNVTSVLLALLSAVSFSVYTVLCKKTMTKLSGIIQSGISFLIGSIVLVIVLLIAGVDVCGGISANTIGPLLYVSVVVTGIGYWAFFGAIKTGGPHIAALAFMIKPILAPFASLAINKVNDFSPNVIIAIILVVIGAVMASGTLQNLKGGLKK